MLGYNWLEKESIYYIRELYNKYQTKHFVAHYLGSQKPREFFLARNTPMTKQLFNLKDDELAIVADGTYGRCEKSLNNDFQYKTYSSQKQVSLIIPFIVSCANGYIIDCYGPFAANKKDAKIFEYILRRDVELQNILQADRTVLFLDRGIFHLFSFFSFFFD